MSRNNLTPGTAIESQAKGLPVDDSPPTLPRQRLPGSVPTSAGSSPLSHDGIIIRRFTSAEIGEALRIASERARPYFRPGGRLW